MDMLDLYLHPDDVDHTEVQKITYEYHLQGQWQEVEAIKAVSVYKDGRQAVHYSVAIPTRGLYQSCETFEQAISIAQEYRDAAMRGDSIAELNQII